MHAVLLQHNHHGPNGFGAMLFSRDVALDSQAKAKLRITEPSATAVTAPLTNAEGAMAAALDED
jgi:hypothetical protein